MHDSKLLGLAIRARWLGFAVLDKQNHLLDWGMIFYQRKSPAGLRSAQHRLENVMTRTTPSVIAIALPNRDINEKVSTVRSVTRLLCSAAASRSIRFVRLRRSVMQTAFASRNAKSKEEIAEALATEFPELAWKLPPERKIWEREDPGMALFDALAAAVAYASK